MGEKSSAHPGLPPGPATGISGKGGGGPGAFEPNESPGENVWWAPKDGWFIIENPYFSEETPTFV